jgi:hypothetical protein
VGGFARCVTARTSRQGGCEGDDQMSTHRRNRVGDMSFGADGRRLGVCNFGEPQASRIDRWRRRQLRGEPSPARRSGRHRRRYTAWRDGGSRASRVPRSARGRAPVSAPGNRARCASAVSPDRPGDRRGCPAGRWLEPDRFKLNRHSRESGNPEPPFRRLPLDPRFRGGDGSVSI